MNKHRTNCIFMLLTCFFLLFQGLAAQPMMRDNPVSLGEELEFKLSYGWFTVGRAKMKTSDYLKNINGKDAYKVDIEGRTAGLVGTFSRVDDKWGAHVDASSFLPYYSYRDISEGNYRLDEKVYYNYEKNEIRADYYDVKKDVPKPSQYFEIGQTPTFDLIGGLLFARSLDYLHMNQGDTITMDAFFEKKFYSFSFVYQGVERVRTKVGKINCFKIVPIVPDNKIFRGENSVTFWVSADANRLPLKVEADMFFGTAYCELTSYKNVKSGIDFD